MKPRRTRDLWRFCQIQSLPKIPVGLPFIIVIQFLHVTHTYEGAWKGVERCDFPD